MKKDSYRLFTALLAGSVLLFCSEVIANSDSTIITCTSYYPSQGAFHLDNDDVKRRALLSCLGTVAQAIKEKKIKRKNCLLRVASPVKYNNCKAYNNAITKIKQAIKWEEIKQKQDRHKFNSTRFFKGSKCSIDCSGHKAGYSWAENSAVNSASDCRNDSDSFVNGCLIYLNEIEEYQDRGMEQVID